jgi:hypothetical protein
MLTIAKLIGYVLLILFAGLFFASAGLPGLLIALALAAAQKGICHNT